ncbi:hypothetical protein [Bacteroides clarus]|uniref:hypothetical protein n=1 Tax=Bacteroides clarus TaxID=626929 RepID=UPI0015F5F95C|nr:hypothetical protein [Bacteroides clarus]
MIIIILVCLRKSGIACCLFLDNCLNIKTEFVALKAVPIICKMFEKFIEKLKMPTAADE